MASGGKLQHRNKRGVLGQIRWWWNTRIKSWWTVKLPALFGKHTQAPVFEFASRADELADTSTSRKSSAGDKTVTAILNVYKRSRYLAAQVKALREQTHPPDEIWVWCNSSDEDLHDFSPLVDRIVVSNTNWKFWGRFSLANMARTEYVCLFDDDTLPQPQWIQNCLDTVAAGYDGILGGSGVVLQVDGSYNPNHKVGWNGIHSDDAIEVDLVGHAWFFRKAHLKYMWEEQPYTWENGEDIHLSYMAQRYGNIKTWVPPHPESKPELWSCRPDFGKAVGRSSTATFKTSDHRQLRDDIVDAYRTAAWRITAEGDV